MQGFIVCFQCLVSSLESSGSDVQTMYIGIPRQPIQVTVQYSKGTSDRPQKYTKGGKNEMGFVEQYHVCKFLKMHKHKLCLFPHIF